MVAAGATVSEAPAEMYTPRQCTYRGVIMNMPGIEFLIDRMGRKKAVLIDLKKHKELWEDLYDAYVAHHRRNEPRESLAAVKKLIETKAKRKARG